jgi:hypothetical protein
MKKFMDFVVGTFGALLIVAAVLGTLAVLDWSLRQ